MIPHQLKRQTDTFGCNRKADMEILRGISERATDKSEEIFAIAMVSAAFFALITVVVCIVRMFI